MLSGHFSKLTAVIRGAVRWSMVGPLALTIAGIGTSRAEDVVRFGIQIGGLSVVRVTLPETEKKFGLKYDFKQFRDSTPAMLAVEQKNDQSARIGTFIDLPFFAKASGKSVADLGKS